jgi:hypothetical protein
MMITSVLRKLHLMHLPHTDHMKILQEILSAHYEEMVYTLHPGDAVQRKIYDLFMIPGLYHNDAFDGRILDSLDICEYRYI